MRTLILSDLHLGSRSSRAEAVLPALEKYCRQFDSVILNGDVLDRFEGPGRCERNDRLAARARAALCSRAGEPEILAGNHDPGLSERNWVYLEPSHTLVFHGDCIQDYTHPSRKHDQMLRAHLEEAWRSMNGRPSRFLDLVDIYRAHQREFLRANPYVYEQRSKAFYLFRAFVPPYRPLQILAYWHRAPRMVAELALTFDKPLRNVVVGHTHRAGEWDLRGLRVFNTGSFMPLSKPLAVIADDSELSVQPLDSVLRT